MGFGLEQEGLSISIMSTNVGPLGRIMCQLFRDASLDPLPTVWNNYPLELGLFIDALFKDKSVTFKLTSKRFAFPLYDLAEPRKNVVLVGFSAGKDATAAALKLQSIGKTIELFYVKGINRAYPGEYEAAQKIAEIMGWKLHVIEVKQSGTSNYVENPIKNQFILGLMVEFGMKLGITEYVQGGLSCDTIETQSFSSGYSDAHEMFTAMTPFLKSVLPAYVYHHGLLKNDTDSLLTVIKYAPQLMNHIHSCMGPLRYKNNLRKGNMEKYGVTLTDTECGSCYKCALKYLHLALIDHVVRNPTWEDHCYDMLITALGRILGGKHTKEGAIKEFIDIGQVEEFNRG